MNNRIKYLLGSWNDVNMCVSHAPEEMVTGATVHIGDVRLHYVFNSILACVEVVDICPNQFKFKILACTHDERQVDRLRRLRRISLEQGIMPPTPPTQINYARCLGKIITLEQFNKVAKELAIYLKYQYLTPSCIQSIISKPKNIQNILDEYFYPKTPYYFMPLREYERLRRIQYQRQQIEFNTND